MSFNCGRVHITTPIGIVNSVDTNVIYDTVNYRIPTSIWTISDPSKLIIPASKHYSIFHTSIWAGDSGNPTSQRIATLKKNGSVISKVDRSSDEQGNTFAMQFYDQLFLNPNDYLQMVVKQTATGTLNLTGNFGISEVKNPLVKLTKSSDQTVTVAGSYQNITFDGEDWDTGGYHSNITNTHKAENFGQAGNYRCSLRFKMDYSSSSNVFEVLLILADASIYTISAVDRKNSDGSTWCITGVMRTTDTNPYVYSAIKTYGVDMTLKAGSTLIVDRLD